MDIAKPPRRGVLIAVEGIATWIVSAILDSGLPDRYRLEAPLGGPQEVGMVQVDDGQFRRLVLRSLVTGLLVLALAGCGSEGGGQDQQAVEAPLCDPPADLACPEGMTTEEMSGALGVGTVCAEASGVNHVMILRRDGDVTSYSPPPFDTRTECWPATDDRQPTAWRYVTDLNTSLGTATCFDLQGARADCDDMTDQANAAWGLGE